MTINIHQQRSLLELTAESNIFEKKKLVIDSFLSSDKLSYNGGFSGVVIHQEYGRCDSDFQKS